MRGKRLSIGLRAALAIFTVTLFATSTLAAPHETVLRAFNPITDGAHPHAGLVMDAAGNLYGTTFANGTYNHGTVFESTRAAGGGWTEKVLYSFNNNGTDGTNPEAGLIFDTAGNLYGTTYQGGTYSIGTVFELTPTAGGGWTEKVLHSFNKNGTDGAHPHAGLVMDAAGNLYGTTFANGTYNHGTVFELTRAAGGGWTEKVLYSFNNNGTDGTNPEAGLIFDTAGNLYGTTYQGGTYSIGTVFELTPTAGGGWTEKVLYSFNNNGTDGTNPEAGVILDAGGDLYGTTYSGGTYNNGTVFELTPTAGGGWTEQVLHHFNLNGTDGANPEAGLIFDAAGNLYGTTDGGGAYGGFYGGDGTVFELTPTAGGGWTEEVLHNFGNSTDGINTHAGLIFDTAGNLYGTTDEGGAYGNSDNAYGASGYGTVFELTPTAGGGWTEEVVHSFNFNGTDGASPHAGLIFDAAGNLYGTTTVSGTYSVGTVFELTPTAGGGWTEKVLYNFNSPLASARRAGADGAFPYASLIFDVAGNLYGTTNQGGTQDTEFGGVGTVFELTRAAGGGWTERVLHNFDLNGTDGANPEAGLIFDAAGNLYGTTGGGGTYSAGTVFKLTPAAGGGWTEQVLHSFNQVGTDGVLPEAGLIFDAASNLYGTTSAGGTYSAGTVFELTPAAGGGWTEKVLHSFHHNGTDGTNPEAGLIFDAAGNLYGTTSGGGTYYYGTVFELTPAAGGGWTEKVLHSFHHNGTDGTNPEAGLIFDAAGNLYGTTSAGGAYSLGTVFKLTPAAGGGWTEQVLHNFNVNGTDGAYPYAGLIIDAAGNLYGTTSGGGTYYYGTVFELTP